MNFRIRGLLCGLVSFAFILSSASFAEMRDIVIPNYDAWVNSPHADIEGEPFTHWDEEDDKMVEEHCAACHSTTGHLDFLGADGSTPHKVDAKAPGREGVQCTACHNRVASHLEEITFPSGQTVERFEADARCMDCHQGRESGASVTKMIVAAGVDDDTVSKDVKFLNVHYAAAAATRFGTEAGGGYEYEGMDYSGLHYHDDFATQCNDCHNPHSLKISVKFCTECHEDVKSKDDWAMIRDEETEGDFDANGVETGIKTEVENMHIALLKAMQDYASQVLGSSINYDGHHYPYFFADPNGNGVVDDGEAVRANMFKQWTPRLAKAAYNYQFVAKDKGAWVHNGQYVLQLLNDSIQDLGKKVAVPATMRPEPF
ncbi:MAG: hypothetical protein P8X74_01875 [Reinekea sp.]